jgi:hypothetical protein
LSRGARRRAQGCTSAGWAGIHDGGTDEHPETAPRAAPAVERWHGHIATPPGVVAAGAEGAALPEVRPAAHLLECGGSAARQVPGRWTERRRRRLIRPWQIVSMLTFCCRRGGCPRAHAGTAWRRANAVVRGGNGAPRGTESPPRVKGAGTLQSPASGAHRIPPAQRSMTNSVAHSRQRYWHRIPVRSARTCNPQLVRSCPRTRAARELRQDAVLDVVVDRGAHNDGHGAVSSATGQSVRGTEPGTGAPRGTEPAPRVKRAGTRPSAPQRPGAALRVGSRRWVGRRFAS